MPEPIPETVTDETLARRAKRGDTEAFGTLVDRYEQKLLRYGRKFLSTREDIEDIVQNIFVSAYQNIRGFDHSHRFSPWIYRIAHNAFVNGLRARSRSRVISINFDTFLAHPAYDDPSEREREQEELKEMIAKGLEKLQPDYREVLILYYLEEMSYKDISDVLAVPTGTVGIRLTRAKKALKAAYETMHMTYE